MEKFFDTGILISVQNCMSVPILASMDELFQKQSPETIFAKTHEKNRIFSHFSSPSPLQCWFLVRLRSGLGHNQAAKSLSFKSGDHILGPTLFRGGGAGGAEKSKR